MPVHLTAKATQDGGLQVAWIRRTRVDGDLWEGLEVPLGEETENYLIKVVKNGIVVREETVSQPGWIYPLSAQASDGLTGGFEISVAQVSATYGPGPAAQLSLTV
jgi:hypothetical protein